MNMSCFLLALEGDSYQILYAKCGTYQSFEVIKEFNIKYVSFY